ncbi:hypothetical protein JTB14_020233 [Gonioctena quinquepunctata]|nr:hypothetical protein JTB14_020233 [Gonioctena quinquepunctata]
MVVSICRFPEKDPHPIFINNHENILILKAGIESLFSRQVNKTVDKLLAYTSRLPPPSIVHCRLRLQRKRFLLDAALKGCHGSIECHTSIQLNRNMST